MATPLTFVDKKLLDTVVIGPEGAVYYTTRTTTSGGRNHNITTITAASGLLGFINWPEKVFVINGMQRPWDDLRERWGGLSEREWNWGNRPYKLKYNESYKELLANPLTTGNHAGAVRFTTFHSHLFHDDERAVIYFPHQMQDEIERMFLLMAILQTEIHRQDETPGLLQSTIDFIAWDVL
ncbi:hypothetical protein B0H19DRAFT_1075772 [Mycena capillaripes]|nr:hypothetical protein B0H19DRAFT_1075772 [Mycena capillaripes]